jgi:hypothetical protein
VIWVLALQLRLESGIKHVVCNSYILNLSLAEFKVDVFCFNSLIKLSLLSVNAKSSMRV